jgi:hypothetical protein
LIFKKKKKGKNGKGNIKEFLERCICICNYTCDCVFGKVLNKNQLRRPSKCFSLRSENLWTSIIMLLVFGEG